MSIKVKGFDWDEGNTVKCQKHGLSLQEIEAFFLNSVFVNSDIKHSQTEERFLAVGKSSSKKPMFVVFTFRNNLIRPISARYMHSKEVQKYEKIFTDNTQ